MKLQAEINSEKHEIEIRREGRQVFARIDERIYELEAAEVEPNVYLLKNENKIYEILISGADVQNQRLKAKVKGVEFEINLIDPKKLRNANTDSAAAAGIAEIKTAMPGKLVRILVEVGADISAGEPVLVVEAMKMQNEMKSPKDGIVKEIRFEEGATVTAGDVLAIIE